MGYVSPWVRGLRGSDFYVGCVGYVGQNNFYVGQHIMWVINCTWVAWIKYLCVGQNFLCGSIFLRGSTFFARV